MKLPKHVAFKGQNGHYLGVLSIDDRPHLLFESKDVKHSTEEKWHKIITHSDGSIRIKSMSTGQFWRLVKDGWIVADSDDSSTSSTVFWPTKLPDHVIALRSDRNDKFCKRISLDSDLRRSSFSAISSTVEIESCLEVEEIYLKRTVSHVKPHLQEASVYNQQDVQLGFGEAVNRSKGTHTATVRISYTKTRTSTWHYPHSPSMLKLGSVHAPNDTGIPVIWDNRRVEIEYGTGPVRFGKKETVTSDEEEVYQVVLPGMTRMKVKLFAEEATCDVPFSFTQHDTLPDGEIFTGHVDGVYTGVNTFRVRFKEGKVKKISGLERKDSMERIIM